VNTENIPAEPIAPQSPETSATEAVPSAQSAPTEQIVEHRFQFTGSGDEYFRIWIVNLLLSILTLGIYSAWAKVRREQYFHRNTLLNGSGFDYHGNPIAILKGRVIAVGFFGILTLIENLNSHLYYPLLLAVSPLVPWLLIRSFIFRVRNISYRGLHFDFYGKYKELCKIFLGPFVILILISWGLFYLPEEIVMENFFTTHLLYAIAAITGCVLLFLRFIFAQYRFKVFQFNHLSFGASKFCCAFKFKSFLSVYLRLSIFAIIVSTLFLIAAGVGTESLMVFFGESLDDSISEDVILYVSIFLIYVILSPLLPGFFNALMANLIWNNTRLDNHSFKSNQTFGSVFKVVFPNWLLTVFTLGLYWPWAKIRLARYRAEHTAILTADELNNFVSRSQPKQSAYGEEIADIFDFDFGF
jgi:uncharacterized membrane protein YjgN (DUF898 family)